MAPGFREAPADSANVSNPESQALGFDTPVLLIAWRRPDTTRQVINSLRHLAPSQVYVASDGPPARQDVAAKVRETRSLIEQEIDWPCRLELNFASINQGCGHGPISAINWFFEQVEEGIVLEDDCLPRHDFLPFCADLLQRYRHDRRVWTITGTNYQNGQWRGDGSYYFSQYHHSWGWATWRDRWQHNDPDLIRWPTLKDSGLLASIFNDPVELAYWSGIWSGLHVQGAADVWDYQWAFTCFSNHGLTVTPNTTLVANIGFGEDSTHTSSEGPLNVMGTAEVMPLRHPTFVLRDQEADLYTFDHWFRGLVLRNQMDRSLNRRLRRGLRRAWRKLHPVAES